MSTAAKKSTARKRIYDYTQADIDAYEENIPTIHRGPKCTIKKHEPETATSFHAFDSLMAEFNDR